MIELTRPLLLLALLGVPLFGIARRRLLSRAAIPHAPLQLAETSGFRTWRAGLLRWQVPFEMLLLTALIIALAGPGRHDTIELVGEEGLDIALALDISASMQAADFPPNRLEALKYLAVDFVRRSGNDRIAVYAFARHVFSQTPLTTDHGALSSLIEGLAFKTIDHAGSGGTALGDALLAAADGLLRSRMENRDQVIVLITDGESNFGVDPILAARFAAENEFALYVIGVGGNEPVEVFVDGKPFITSEDTILKTSLDDTQLQEIAAAADGTYLRARDVDVLAGIFDDLTRLDTAPLEIEAVEVKRSYVPAVSALLFFLFAAWLLTDGFVLRTPLR